MCALGTAQGRECPSGDAVDVAARTRTIASSVTSVTSMPALLSLGTIAQTQSGKIGVVSVIFGDSSWVQKFVNCPGCNKAMWTVDLSEADQSPDAGPQYLLVDGLGQWRIVDAAFAHAARDVPITKRRRKP